MTLAQHEPQGQHIRKTSDGRFSVFDALRAVGASNPRAAWERITTTYREVVAKTDNFQFAGRGQRETPVTSLEGWRSILTVLPGILGDQYRADANQLVTAFLERPLELATAIQQAIPVQPKSQTRLLLESVQAMVLLEERTDGLESRATEIESRQEKLEQRLLDESMNASEEGEIYALGQRLGREIGYGKAWRLFNARFKLASYKRLQRRFVPDGKRFLEFQIAAYCGSLV